jgi:hypothetical protein
MSAKPILPVLFYSRDPGGTNALIALCDRLAVGDVDARLDAWVGSNRIVLAKPPGLDEWRAAGIAVAPYDEATISAAIVTAQGVRALVTATSDIDDDTDIKLWRTARAAGVKTAAILDSTANLAVRFRARDGVWTLPDLILCADDAAVTFVSGELGIPPQRCLAVGSLHLDRIQREAARYGQAEIDEVRRQWGCRPGERVALFCSECGEEMRLEGREPTYDEHDALASLLREAATSNAGGPYDRIVVRPHPRDRAGKYERHRKTDQLPWLVERQTPALLALLAADAVVGLGSAMLGEACRLGRPTISLAGAVADENAV